MKTALADYRRFPIVSAAARRAFNSEEIENDRLLKGILEGHISLEDRLERMPHFNYDFSTLQRNNGYHGASVQELKDILHNGKKEVRTETRPGLLSILAGIIKKGLDLLYDTEVEVVESEEISLKDRRDKSLESLRTAREQEKVSKQKLEEARGSLAAYLGETEMRYQQDKAIFSKLAAFSRRLREEIGGLQARLERDGLTPSEKNSYQEQLYRGQEYFNRLVDEIGYVRREMDLLSSSRERYSRMQLRMDSLIQKKGSRIRESLVKIKEGEMTQDLEIIVEAAECLVEINYDTKELEELNQDIVNLVDAAFDAVDGITATPLPKNEDPGNYRRRLYNEKSMELDRLLGG